MIATTNRTPLQQGDEAFITIVAPTTAEVMRQFRERGLAAAGYAIAGRIAPHVFAMGGMPAGTEPFGGKPMMAATFIRASSKA